MDSVVSDEVRRIIATGITTIDEVDLLFHLAQGAMTTDELALRTRFDAQLVTRLVGELEDGGLVTRSDGRVHITSGPRDRAAIDELLAIYNSRPVTLIRAIYARELLSRSVTEAISPKRME